MKHRVLMVHALGGMRGPARTLSLLAPEVAQSWDVDVAAPRGFLTETLSEYAERICVLPLHGSRFRSWSSGSRRIHDFVRRGPALGLIHANGLSALNLAAPTARATGLPVLVHFHGYETGRRARSLAKYWGRFGVRIALHPVSGRARDVLYSAGLGQYAGEVLPNPVEFPAVPDLRHNQAIRVGFVGSASRRKGLHLLVDIALKLRAEPLTWHVYGIDERAESSYLQICRDRLISGGIADRVSWGGVVRDAASAYRAMDVLLVPSLRESWCRVAMEGMASGLPVVATEIPGMSELLAQIPGALTFPVDRPDIGADHVLRLTKDSSLRSSLGAKGREAMRVFDVRSVASQLLKDYEVLLGSAA